MATGTELATAYVHIIPSTKGFGAALSEQVSNESGSAGNTAGGLFGSGFASTVTKIIAAAGIGETIKKSLEAGGALQQSVGGVETLFGDMADQVKNYANEAFNSAGLSANDYMETVTGFAATLMQGLGDDTSQAAEIANTAVVDMSDNANKMGTSMESIQAAYQGFAKQNYSMLDNLKLGYGGTQAEMARLINDSKVLGEGIEVDAKTVKDVPFDKIIEAIHTTQEGLGITGTTAAEAASTFSGSMASMSAAATNVLAALTNPENMDLGAALNSLGDTVSTFLMGNLFPMIGNLLKQLPDVIGGLSGLTTRLLNMISQDSGAITQGAIDIIMGLTTALIENAPYMIEAAVALVAGLVEALFDTDWASVGQAFMDSITSALDMFAGDSFGADSAADLVSSFSANIQTQLPGLVQSGVEMINNLSQGITDTAPELLLQAGEILASFTQGLAESYPTILQGGTDLLLALISGISSALPEIMTSAGQALNMFLDAWLSNLPEVLSAGVQCVVQIVQGIASALPDIAAAAVEVFGMLVDTLLSHLPEILQTGLTLIGELAAGLIQALPDIIAAIATIIAGMINKIMETDWIQVGKDILTGIKNGLLAMGEQIIEALVGIFAKAWELIKHLFTGGKSGSSGTKSASKTSSVSSVAQDSMNAAVNSAIQSATASVSLESMRIASEISSKNDNAVLARLDAMLTLMSEYYPEIADGSNSNEFMSTSLIDRQLGMAVEV